MKNKDFYHTYVEIKEYPFEKIFLEELNDELIENVKLFNSSKDVVLKKELANKIHIEFPKCRFCEKIIINSNFKIELNQKEKTIRIKKPSIYCREINYKKYYLSCCEDCLLEHFKDNLPKSNKYYFMKANKYGQYCFGYSDEEYKKICSMTVGVTKESMIRKWGEDLGKQKWKEYCNKQAITNTFEYKQEKYGWDKETFDKFNASRAITKENLIKKYGENIGLIKWNDYVNKQKITKSFEYMVNKFGYDNALKINKSKAITLYNFIKKYGKVLGEQKYKNIINNHNFYSHKSQKLFNELDKYLSKKYTTYYATKNHEYFFKINDKYIFVDYFIKELNICIEFNGSVFHGESRLYEDDEQCNPFSNMTAKEIRDKDNIRYSLLKKLYNVDTYVIWELDYNENFNIKNYINNILNIKLD